MPQLQVSSIEQEHTVLQVVFVPPETSYFDGRQRARLREILTEALQRRGLLGELIAVWEGEGELQFMGNPHWVGFLESAGYANLRKLSDASISVD